jgi:membrane protein required for colicin V production
MAAFDYVVIGIIAISLAIGLWRGVIGEMIAIVAWVAAVMGALEFGTATGQSVFAGVADPAVRALAGCTLVFVAILVAMSVIRLIVRQMVKALGLSLSDRMLGMLFGLARGVLVVLVLVAAGGMTSAPQQPWWRQASLAPPLETAILAVKPMLPDDLAKRIRFS